MVVALETAVTERVEVRKQDVREEFYRASGAGGQHRNKTASAVKLTHVLTGITAISADERSQYQNREIAWRRLCEKVQVSSTRDEQACKAEEKASQFNLAYAWTWTDYADEVKSPAGVRMSMKKALRGDLTRVLS